MVPIPTLEDLMEKSIFELLNIDAISDDKKEVMLAKMRETVEARVIERFMAELPPEESATFAKSLESNDQEVVANSLTAHADELNQIIGEEVTRYRLELSALIGVVSNPDS